MHHMYHHIGFTAKAGDDHLTKVFRSSFMNFACRSNLGHCVQDANKEFDKNKHQLSE